MPSPRVAVAVAFVLGLVLVFSLATWLQLDGLVKPKVTLLVIGLGVLVWLGVGDAMRHRPPRR